MRPIGAAVLAAAGLLAAQDFHVTKGAAPGYVPDRVCGGCHRELWESYQHVGMSHSFSRPRQSDAIESFGGKPFVHQKSQQWMELVWRDGALLFRRWQTGPDGKPVNLFEQQVDWILGSGHHSRTYLYRTPGGELYQLPLAWYSQTQSWGMAPGYDRRDHEGVTRRVRHECLFCHNAYPEIAEERKSYWRAQTFPAELPEGIGCQRCHGPGAAHVEAVRSGKMEEIHSSIVVPSRLDPARRNDVCYECHMQASVSLPGLRRFDRDLYSFRPGQQLSDSMLHLDVTEEGRTRGERFEINHHPYRLEQSRCFIASRGRLSCLSCHDPHRVVPAEDRAAHYRSVCTGCHKAAHDPPIDAATADCVACHMPKRRTQDVVHVVMTDHLIRRKPAGAELLTPLDERDPQLAEIDFLEPAAAPGGAVGELYRAAALVRASGGSSAAAVRRLQDAIARAHPAEIEPYLDLGMGLLRQKQYAALEKTTLAILEREPKNAQATEWLGAAQFWLGRTDEGLATIGKSLALDPDRAEAHFNLGLLLESKERCADAIPELLRATQLRPNLAAAWYHLGQCYVASDQREEAVAAYRRALAIEPQHSRAAAALERLTTSAGSRK